MKDSGILIATLLILVGAVVGIVVLVKSLKSPVEPVIIPPSAPLAPAVSSTLKVVIAPGQGVTDSAKAIARHVWEFAIAHPELRTLTVVAYWDKNALTDRYGNPVADDSPINPPGDLRDPPYVLDEEQLNELRKYRSVGVYVDDWGAISWAYGIVQQSKNHQELRPEDRLFR